MSHYGRLWLVVPDELGREIGSAHVAVEVDDTTLRNLTAVSFPIGAACVSGAAYFCRERRGPAILRLPSSAGRHLLAGDTLSYGVGKVSIELGKVMTPELVLPDSTPKSETFEQFMEQYPDATHREVWDAAYAAGGQLVHTLLTGECE